MPKERWFLVLLGVSLVALAYVLSPFLYTFAVAAVIAVITWSPYQRLVAALGGRHRLAAGLFTGGVLLVIAVPVSLLTLFAAVEVVALADQGLQLLATTDPSVFVARLDESYARVRASGELAELLPAPADLVSRAVGAVESLLLEVTRAVGAGLPAALGRAWRLSIDLVAFCVAVYSAYVRGPDLLHAVRTVAPIPPEYVERLFEVFRQFATNVALGMVVAGAAQGLIAALGFWIAGVPGELVLGLVTAVTSVVPVVGSAVVWVPVAGLLALQGHSWSALFVTVWSVAVTASADNLIKPLLFRNQLQVSPLLMLLSLFGGLLVLGAQGLVFGPSVLVLYLTLYTLYVRDFVPAAEGQASRR